MTLFRMSDKRITHTFAPYVTRKDDILVCHEASLRELEVELNGKIVETPGHSTDSISVELPDGDWLVGDAAANIPEFAETRYCAI